MKTVENTRVCGNCPIPDDGESALCESAANIANVDELDGIYQSTSEIVTTDDRIAIERGYLQDQEVSPNNIALVKKCADKILSGTCEFHNLDNQYAILSIWLYITSRPNKSLTTKY